MRILIHRRSSYFMRGGDGVGRSSCLCLEEINGKGDQWKSRVIRSKYILPRNDDMKC
jgi:hypothetical protein